jgi:glutamine synthetase
MKPRLTFNEEINQWVLETPVVLNLRQVDNVVKFTFEIYKKRLIGTIGEKRKRMEQALKLLNNKNIQQKLVGPEPTFYFAGKY